MQNLTVLEFNKLYTKHVANVKRELKKFKALEKAGELDMRKYKGTPGINFFERNEILSDDLNYNGGVDTAIEILIAFKEEYKEYENKISFGTDSDFYVDSDGYIEHICYEAHWYNIIDEVPEQSINKSFKNKVADLLKPENVEYTISIDCKLLTLFKDGKISWDTLRTLVYSDCEI